MSSPENQSAAGPPAAPVPEPLKERVKIVHFPVGNGDCTLIMIRGRDTRGNWHALSFLIDTGSTGNFPKRWEAIWAEIKCEHKNLPEIYKAQEGLKPKLDYFIISHFDDDHAGHAGDLLLTLKTNRDDERGKKVKSLSDYEWSWVDYLFIVDRLSGATIPPTSPTRRPPSLNRSGGERRRPIPYLEAYYNERKDFELRSFDGVVEVFPIGGVLPIRPDTDLLKISQTFDLAHFEMVCVAANGWVGGEEKISLYKDDGKTKLRSPKDLENDLGLAFVLRFGSFRFYIGGDLTGTEGTEGVDGSFTITNSMEVPLVNHLKARWNRPPTPATPGFAFHACAALLHHHGSKQSTFGDFLSFFNPRVAVCSAVGRFGKGKAFPNRDLIARFRVADARRGLYTDKGSRPEEGSYKHRQGSPLPECALLFTCRVEGVGQKGMVCGLDGQFRRRQEGFGHDLAVVNHMQPLGWVHAAGQDVIIEVTEDDNHSPLKSRESPLMHISRRVRELLDKKTSKSGSYELVESHELEPLPGVADQGVVCTDRSHDKDDEILVLLPPSEKKP